MMGLFGKSEQQRQVEETARQLEITRQKQEEVQHQMEIGRRQLEEYDARQKEVLAQMERSRTNQERYEQLLDTWEDHARRFEAFLTRIEKRFPE